MSFFGGGGCLFGFRFFSWYMFVIAYARSQMKVPKTIEPSTLEAVIVFIGKTILITWPTSCHQNNYLFTSILTLVQNRYLFYCPTLDTVIQYVDNLFVLSFCGFSFSASLHFILFSVVCRFHFNVYFLSFWRKDRSSRKFHNFILFVSLVIFRIIFIAL